MKNLFTLSDLAGLIHKVKKGVIQRRRSRSVLRVSFFSFVRLRTKFHRIMIYTKYHDCRPSRRKERHLMVISFNTRSPTSSPSGFFSPLNRLSLHSSRSQIQSFTLLDFGVNCFDAAEANRRLNAVILALFLFFYRMKSARLLVKNSIAPS